MKNREKFEKEILNIACNGGCIAIDKNGNLVNCNVLECGECAFWKDYLCNQEELVPEWCEAEYVEKPTLTANEKAFLNIIKEQYKYIARDEKGDLCVYENMPIKCTDVWGNRFGSSSRLIKKNCFADINFDFIRWEDEEPWAIDDLKKLEVKNDSQRSQQPISLFKRPSDFISNLHSAEYVDGWDGYGE